MSWWGKGCRVQSVMGSMILRMILLWIFFYERFGMKWWMLLHMMFFLKYCNSTYDTFFRKCTFFILPTSSHPNFLMEMFWTCIFKIAENPSVGILKPFSVHIFIYVLDIRYLDKKCVASSNWNVHPKCFSFTLTPRRGEGWNSDSFVVCFIEGVFETQIKKKKRTKHCFWIPGAKKVHS